MVERRSARLGHGCGHAVDRGPDIGPGRAIDGGFLLDLIGPFKTEPIEEKVVLSFLDRTYVRAWIDAARRRLNDLESVRVGSP